MSEKREVKCPYCQSLLYCENTNKEKEKQMFEKIEKMAWELFLKSPDKNGWTLSDCWKVATQFYDYAKQKQEEANDDNT